MALMSVGTEAAAKENKEPPKQQTKMAELRISFPAAPQQA